MKSAKKRTPLGQTITEHLQKLGWSGSELERRAKLSTGTISRLLRGLISPSHNTVEAIADALQIDALRLKEIAGLRTVTPPAKRDSRVEYIAQRLEELPPDIREEAIDAVGGVIDAIYNLTKERREG